MGVNGHRAMNAAKAQNLEAIKKMWPMIVRIFVGAGVVLGILVAYLVAGIAWIAGMD